MHNFRKYSARACKIVVFIIALAVVMNISGETLELKTWYTKYGDFYDGNMDYDVLFFGSSHVLNGIDPMALYGEYGIKSYNMAYQSMSIPASYWIMMNALDYTEPKTVVLDCYLIDHASKIVPSNYSSYHIPFDAFDFSMTKAAAAFDLLNDPILNEALTNEKISINEEKTPLSFLWNYSLYHSRWNSLTWRDFSPEANIYITKGFTLKNGTQQITGTINLDVEEWKENTIAIDYIYKMIHECKKRDINIVLMYLPCLGDQVPFSYRVEKIAEEEQVECVNFFKENVVSYQTDFFDHRGHLNGVGAYKVTTYLGKLFTEQICRDNTGISTEPDDMWDQELKQYQEDNQKRLLNEEDFETVVSMSRMPVYNTEIVASDEWSMKAFQSLYPEFNINLKRDDLGEYPAWNIKFVYTNIDGTITHNDFEVEFQQLEDNTFEMTGSKKL